MTIDDAELAAVAYGPTFLKKFHAGPAAALYADCLPATQALSNPFTASSIIVEIKQPCRALQWSHSSAIF